MRPAGLDAAGEGAHHQDFAAVGIGGDNLQQAVSVKARGQVVAFLDLVEVEAGRTEAGLGGSS
ncbi:hypothetical protein A6024_03990 [Rhodovulum sulfidophilum]|nr:hypothetical protein A6024_03990 [Rhodovulum sulfidophilum]